MHHFDLDHLATIVAIARRASFSAAARDVNKTQAAVSFIVARLERRLERRLFDRSPRGVTPTAHGKLLISYATRLLALETEALATFTGVAPRGVVRLGMPDDYLQTLGHPVIEQFATMCPGVQVELTCDFSCRLEQLLAGGDLELAVITREPAGPRGELLWRERQVWCGPPDASPEHETPLPLALFSAQCRARPMVLRAVAQAGLQCRLAYAFSHLSAIMTEVQRGRALTVLPESSVPTGLRRLGPESGLPELPPLEIALLLRDGANVPTRMLADILRKQTSASARHAA